MNNALKQQALVLLPIFINMAMANCSRSWLANAVYFLRQANHQPSATLVECGWMESSYQIGRFIFAVPSGILSDKYGRKYFIISAGCIQVLTWTALSLTHSIGIFLLVRFLQGCASALTNTTGSSTIGEISSPKYRGTFVVLLKNSGTIGIIVECTLASVFNSYWIMVYATTALTLFFFPFIPYITESPYYLLGVSKYEEAKRCLTKIRRGYSEREISAEYESLKETIENEKTKKSKTTWVQYLSLRSTRNPLICCILLNFLVFTNGTTVIFLYASVIFPPNRYLSNNSYPLILSLVQMASSISAILVIDAFPRRYLFMLSGFLSFFIQSFNGIAYYEYISASQEGDRNLWRWAFLLGTVIFWVLTNAVISPLNGTVKTEMLPLSIRGLGNSICLICQSVSTIISYQVFSLVEKHFSIACNYVIFAINSLLLVLVVYFLVPETRGKTLAEVQQYNNVEKMKSDKKIYNNNNNNNNNINNNNNNNNNNDIIINNRNMET